MGNRKVQGCKFLKMGGDEQKKKKVPKLIKGKWDVTKRLGAGCFGEVYEGKNREDGVRCAIKMEDSETNDPQLQVEEELLKEIRWEHANPQGFVTCFHFGQEPAEGGVTYNCLVMELLGKSLEDRVEQCKGKFTSKTTAMVAIQVLMRIEYLHSRGYVHRDIKPGNFVLGVDGKVHHIFIIDFGLSKRYWSRRENKHVELPRAKKSVTGTARYASINSHKGNEL